ncbi:MAG TPA: ABC transporter ATP-binding protein [Acidimicrobiales bacterium]|nr:ABC transporter ATP-binding protein [Acidimicrobiales bacterium]
MTTVIEVHGLMKRYGPHLAVDDVGFAVTEGEIFGILGVNGAGKTTTVECLQGLRKPDSGHMRVLGLDPRTARSRLRALVGSQLQSSALPDRLRVDEAVLLFGDGDRRSADRLLETWNLAGLRRSSFASLSGGQRQRLFIALALLNGPQVVFFDELTQGLDPLARREVWGAIRDVRDCGTTVVLVTHFMDEAEVLCDRVAVMRGGRVVDDGTPAELIERHARSTTVTFTRPASLDPAALAGLPGVDRVEPDGECIRVTGSNQLVAPVCAAALGDDHLGPPDLRVHHPELEDALIALISDTGADPRSEAADRTLEGVS